MPKAIDFCRVNRNTYLIISNSPKKVENITRRLADLRIDGASVRVDDLATIELFCEAGTTPIRIWESHQDILIFAEVYRRHRKVCSLSNAKEEHSVNMTD